jgi:hypothetical protein
VLIKRFLHQSPDHSVPSAKAVCKQGEIYTSDMCRRIIEAQQAEMYIYKNMFIVGTNNKQ